MMGPLDLANLRKQVQRIDTTLRQIEAELRYLIKNHHQEFIKHLELMHVEDE